MKASFQIIFSSIVASAIVLTVSFTVQADVVGGSFFGKNAMFQDVFFGDYTGRDGDIEGHAAIKGNVDAFYYGFGSGQQNLHTGRTVLVVGGNVKAAGSAVFDGDAYIAGNSTGYANKEAVIRQGKKKIINAGYSPQLADAAHQSYVNSHRAFYKETNTAPQGQNWHTEPLGTDGTGNYNFESSSLGYKGTAGSVYTNYNTNSIINFDTAESELRSISAELSKLTPTVKGKETMNYDWGGVGYTIDLATDKLTGLQSVTIDASVINNLTYGNLIIKALVDTTLIINVTDEMGIGFVNLTTMNINDIYTSSSDGGRNYGLEGEMPFYDFDGSDILFNIISGLDVNVLGQEIDASILAVDSDFTVIAGDIGGQVFGKNAYTQDGGEFHNYYTFDDGYLPEWGEDTTTPEPATMLIFGIGIVGSAVASYRRKRNGK